MEETLRNEFFRPVPYPLVMIDPVDIKQHQDALFKGAIFLLKRTSYPGAHQGRKRVVSPDFLDKKFPESGNATKIRLKAELLAKISASLATAWRIEVKIKAYQRR